eukprot:GEMP01046470.1.p1 GENE.GEMP01046470.1~~GEMP01046470.1.p1  ORF type:complete len:246 (-),score=59.39 GEMP01046470.1:603-1340(-)
MIYSYKLVFHNGALLQDGTRTVAAQNVEARWVAVDGMGNLFYTDEIKNTINQVPAEKLFLGETTSKVLYSGKEMSSVSGPGGVATDNFFVFWTNKVDGSTVGSLIRAEEHPPEGGTALSQGGAKAVAQNEAKVYAVCLSQTNAFFTSESSKVYGVKKVGGPVTLINDQFVKPRGCAWDGGGTIFVADRQQNAVYSFAGNMRFLAGAHRSKVVDCEDAFGLAVVSSSGAVKQSLCLLLSLLGALLI